MGNSCALVIPAAKMNWISKLPLVPDIGARGNVRATLWKLLGDIPNGGGFVSATVKDQGEYSLERFELRNGVGDLVPGYLLLPRAAAGTKFPAILYCHWHGDEYHVGKEELFRKDSGPPERGLELVRRGFAVMAIDAYCFGERSGRGPCGAEEKGRDEELSTAKFNLWAGRTLWGMILRDDLLALDYLASRPEIDAARIGVMGISMGATRTWWLMALDERLRAGMAAACLTRYQDLIEAGALNKHGIYYYVPNLLRHFDTEAIVAQIAPRPILFQTGDQDAGSPIEGVRKIERAVKPFWEASGHADAFESVVYPGVGHLFNEAMWARTLEWFEHHLANTV